MYDILMKTAVFLKQKHTKFIYRGYRYKVVKKHLKIAFDFRIKPAIQFKPSLVIKNISHFRFKKTEKVALDNLVFHLGLMEIPTYWKATCSPEIVIEAGYLNKEQIKWWQDLIMKGLGQFFYENRLSWQKPKIICASDKNPNLTPSGAKPRDRWLVPLGGGKDSIVTLEKLRQKGKEVNVFTVNPGSVAKKVMKTAGIKNPVIVERNIDPGLLRLNKKGYFNGHTPFTALLSFLSVFCAVLFDYRNIAFSNEKSADEGNVRYLGRTVNHQWSKSSEFERKFKDYLRKYLPLKINYSSYLRKYSELKIARMFVNYPQYFQAFSSCNVVLAKKLKRRWCGNCPKCLFVYLSLYPYLGKKQLLKIFGQDLFENKRFLPTMRGLLGWGKIKPFECVGTRKESYLAFKLSLKKAQKAGVIPWLLTKFRTDDII